LPACRVYRCQHECFFLSPWLSFGPMCANRINLPHLTRMAKVILTATLATNIMSEIDEALIGALNMASKEIEGLDDLQLFKLMETAESIRRQLQNANIDATRLAVIMMQLVIETSKTEVAEFDIAFA
jgi:replicative DNA helicase